MNKRVTHVLVATAMWSFCMLLIGGVFPRFGIQLLGEFGRPLAEWLPWLLVLLVGTTVALVARLRMQARGEYQDGAAGGEARLPLRSGGDDPVPLLRATGMAGGGTRPGERVDRERPLILRKEGEKERGASGATEPATEPATGLEAGELPLERPRALRTTVQLTPGRVPGVARSVSLPDDTVVDGGAAGAAGRSAPPLSKGSEGPFWQEMGGGRRLLRLPTLAGDLLGRSAELTDLEAARTKNRARVIGLQGTGGIGKISLAVSFANQVAAEYPDAQIHLDLRGQGERPLSVAEAQGQIIRAYRPLARMPEHEQELQRLYQSVLGEQRGILLLENVTSVQQVQSLLPTAGGDGGARWLTIFTARQPLNVPGQFMLRVDLLPTSEARQLLLSLAPRVGPAVDRIVGACGQSPLALRLVGSLINRYPSVSVETLPARLMARQGSAPLAGGPIENALRVAYDLLSESLQRYWRMLAVFPGTFDLSAVAAVWKVHPDTAATLLNQLVEDALVEHDTEMNRYRLHSVILAFVEPRLVGEEQRETRHRCAAHYQSLLHEAEALYEQAGPLLLVGMELLDQEWHNILASQVWATTHAAQDRSACELCSAFPDAGKHLLELRLNPRERIRWSEAALEAARILNRRKAVIRHLVTLGDTYSDLCESQHAIDTYQQSIELARAAQDRRGEALAQIGLGNAYAGVGALDRAREVHEHSLELANQLQDQRLEVTALGNLGRTHYARGEVQTAQLLFDQQFKLARRLGDRHQEAMALGGMGMAELALGKIDLALELLERQLLLAKEIGDRRGQVNALTHLGIAYGGRKEHRRGLSALEEALEICLELADRRAESLVLGGLGTSHLQRQEIEIARQFFDRQLNQTREIGDRRGEGMALLSLSAIALGTANHAQAAELARQALLLTSGLGDSQGQGIAHYRLALALAEEGEMRKARSAGERAYQVLQDTQLPILAEVERKLQEWAR